MFVRDYSTDCDGVRIKTWVENIKSERDIFGELCSIRYLSRNDYIVSANIRYIIREVECELTRGSLERGSVGTFRRSYSIAISDIAAGWIRRELRHLVHKLVDKAHIHGLRHNGNAD